MDSSIGRGVTVARTPDGVATITIDNPPANTLTDEVITQLSSELAAIAVDAEVRAVVIRAVGARTFVAGGDVGELLATAGDAEAARQHVAKTRNLFDSLEALPQPVVAAVSGHAVGGGLELVLCCDLAIASARARFGLPEVGLGLIPGAGGTQRLPRAIGLQAAMGMVLTGTLITADEALARGLVTQVVPVDEVQEAAHLLAARLAAAPPAALRAAKLAIRSTTRLPLDEGLDGEADLFLPLLRDPATTKTLRAFFDRR
ncbi:enoyl-CoA hydratase/isomerase family protein [Streptomyces sp. NPDC046805]|uniref:enoyl-CoA hydratase/isomerase family protein n=1 Tax=Streptomyces sp. NPDC046805 TaxID=3155134 RepID=UPI0033CACE63